MMFYRIMYFIAQILFWFYYNVKVKGKEYIPKEGAAVLVSNHQSNLDPLVLAIQTWRPIHFIGKIELVKNPIGKWFFNQLDVIPVNREKVSPATMKRAIKVLRDGELLGIFPEGTRVKDLTNKPAPMSGFLTFALREKVPVVPVHITGKSLRFRARMDVVIGEPIDLSPYYGQKLKGEKLETLAQEIMDKIYDLQ